MANEKSIIKMPENFGIYKLGNQEVALTADLIRQNVCPTLSDTEVFNFGFLCQQNNLNPFVREAYAVKYGNSPASLIISKQGLANRAERSGHLKSKRGGVIQCRQNPKTGEYESAEIVGSFVEPGWSLWGAWAIVERDDRVSPFEERVLFNEYKNDSNPLWKTKPATMLAKVAMQHALREAFPCEHQAGVYYEEEFSDGLNPFNARQAAAHNDFEEAEEAQVVQQTASPEQGKEPVQTEIFPQ